MATWGHGGLPVTDGGRLVGLVTPQGRRQSGPPWLDHAPVTGFMNRDLVTV